MQNVEEIHDLPDWPPRAPGSNKGTFGKVLLIAGSRGMTGAAVLAGSAALSEGVPRLIAQIDKPLVIDADALNAMAGSCIRLRADRAPIIVTPHPGEFARLLGCTTAQVQDDRTERAVAYAQKTGALVV